MLKIFHMLKTERKYVCEQGNPVPEINKDQNSLIAFLIVSAFSFPFCYNLLKIFTVRELICDFTNFIPGCSKK